MATNYKTLTFSGTGQVWSADETGSAAYFNDGKLYLFYVTSSTSGGDPALMYIHATGSSDLAAQGNWSSAMAFGPPYASDSIVPVPNSTPTTVVTPESLYVFWCDKKKKVLGCSALGWATSVQILDQDGNTLDTSNCEVAACLVGTKILVALTDTSNDKVQYYTLSPKDCDTSSGTWKANQHVGIAQTAFVDNGNPMSKCISIESAVAYEGGKTKSLLVQTLQFSKTYYIFVLALDPQTCLPTGKLVGSAKIGDGMTGGALLTRDPAGRIRYYFGDSDAYVRGGTVSFCKNGDFKLAFSNPSKMFGDDKKTATPPCGVFVPVLVDGQGSTQRWTAREVVFHDNDTGDDQNKFIKLQMADYGTIRKTANPSQNLTATDDKVQLLGYILSPPPLPVQNYTHKTFNFPFNAAQLSYGLSSSGTAEQQTESSGSVAIGARATAGGELNIQEILDVWAEVGFETEVTFGESLRTGTSHEKATEMNLLSTWEVMVNADGLPEYYGQGFAFYRNIVIDSATYDFTDEGKSVPADDAYVSLVFTPEDTSVQIAPFRTSFIDPDDLTSYTEAAYTSVMSRADLYKGSNYIQQYVAPNAVRYDRTSNKFTDDGSQRGLPFAWGSGATVMPHYSEVDTSFTESSWQLDTRIHTSVTADFGLFATASASVWSEIRSAMTSLSSSRLSKGWGIGLTIDVPAPETSGVENPVYQYNGTMYFCPPPTAGSVRKTQWTAELLAGLRGAVTNVEQAKEQNVPWDQVGIAAKIDPSSECWKFCFTVENVYQGTTHLEAMVLPGYLDEPTSKKLSTNGLDTLGKAMQTLGCASLKDLQAAATKWLANPKRA